MGLSKLFLEFLVKFKFYPLPSFPSTKEGKKPQLTLFPYYNRSIKGLPISNLTYKNEGKKKLTDCMP